MKRKASQSDEQIQQVNVSNVCYRGSPRTAKTKAEVKLADIVSQQFKCSGLEYGLEGCPKPTENLAVKAISSPTQLVSASSSECRRTESACHSEMGVAEWIGDCCSNSKGRRFFSGFSKNGQQFRLNDCVYVKSAERDKVWLMKIILLWEEESWSPADSSDINMFFKGVWLYRPSDTPQGPTVALHPREVFVSDWKDDNPIECVQTKCHVSFRSLPPDRLEEINGAHFVCWRSFTVSTGQVSLCLSGGDACPQKSARSMKDAMRSDESMGRLVTIRVGPRDGSDARKLLRQAGHMFADSMIHMPISHIIRLLLASTTETMILFRGEEMVAAATYRKHLENGLMEIELLAVKGCQQRKGYGGVLVEGLCRVGRVWGFEGLMTCADDTAVGFFEACGFEIVVKAMANKLKLTTYDNSILMRMPLLPLSCARSDVPFLPCSLV